VSLRATTIRNLYYQGLLTAAAAVSAGFAVFVLARVLPPAEYGLASFAYLITVTAEMVADFGIQAAVLSRREEVPASVEAAATLRVVLALGGTGALALLALLAYGPLAAPNLAPFLLALSVVPLVSGLGFASQVRLRLDLDFRRLSLAQAGGMVGSPAAQAALALSGFGVWSIIWGAIIGHLLQFALLTALRPAFFRPVFDRAAWRALVRFGSPVIGMGLVSSAFDLTAAAFVALFAGPIALGAFLLGLRVAQLVPLRAMAIVNEVLLPTLSKIRLAGGDLAHPYLESIRAVVIPAAFANMAAVALAAPAVAFVGGARWESAAVCVQVMSLFCILQAATAPGTPFVQVQGAPGASLRQAALCYALLWGLALPVLVFGGLVAFLFALLAIMVVAWAYVGAIVGARGGPSLAQAARAAAPGALCCAAAGLATFALVTAAPIEPLAALTVGAVVYAALALVLDAAAFGGVNLGRVRRFAAEALRPSPAAAADE